MAGSQELPELFTPRLYLRVPRIEDFRPWAEFHADPHSMEHLGGAQHEADAWRALAAMIGTWQLTPAAMFSVIERASGEWIGRVGPWTPHLWPVREVGWGILRRYEGKGYAREAAIACMDFAFGSLGWDSVSHLIAHDNHRSAALAEWLGSRPEGEVSLPGRLADYRLVEWRQTRTEWVARRKALG